MAEIEVPLSLRRSVYWSRREFVCRLTGAVTAGLVGARPHAVAAEPPLRRIPGICIAPQYVAKNILEEDSPRPVRSTPLASRPRRPLPPGRPTSASILLPRCSSKWTPETPSSCWRASTSAALCCSGPSASARCATSKARPSVSRRSAPASTSSWRACWRMSASTRTRMSPG